MHFKKGIIQNEQENQDRGCRSSVWSYFNIKNAGGVLYLFWRRVHSQWAVIVVSALWGGKDAAWKRTYLEIADKTGASTATISRVNRSLNYGNDGYDMVFARIAAKQAADNGQTEDQEETQSEN